MLYQQRYMYNVLYVAASPPSVGVSCVERGVGRSRASTAGGSVRAGALPGRGACSDRLGFWLPKFRLQKYIHEYLQPQFHPGENNRQQYQGRRHCLLAEVTAVKGWVCMWSLKHTIICNGPQGENRGRQREDGDISRQGVCMKPAK